MTPDTRFSINTARFAHETVDDEVIIIDMDEGSYFSLRDSAALVWGLLNRNLSLGEVESALASTMPARCAASRIGGRPRLCSLDNITASKACT